MAYPTSIYCIGRNYAAHAAELGNPVPERPLVFLKSISAVRGLTPAPMAFPDETFHHELELVLRIGRPVGLRQRGTWSNVDGVALGLDVTRRGVQSECKAKGLPWTPAKSFAGSAVLGPFVPLDELGDGPYRLALSVNGERRQEGSTDQMLFDVPALLTALAESAPLLVGDLVYTGTPPGVGPLRVGDQFEMTLADADDGSWSWTGVL